MKIITLLLLATLLTSCAQILGSIPIRHTTREYSGSDSGCYITDTATVFIDIFPTHSSKFFLVFGTEKYTEPYTLSVRVRTKELVSEKVSIISLELTNSSGETIVGSNITNLPLIKEIQQINPNGYSGCDFMIPFGEHLEFEDNATVTLSVDILLPGDTAPKLYTRKLRATQKNEMNTLLQYQ